MKKMITILFCLVLGISHFIIQDINSFSASHKQISEISVQNYREMNKVEFINKLKHEFKQASEYDNVDSLIIITSVFGERLDEFSCDEIFNFADDSENDLFFRATCLQILKKMEGFSLCDSRLSTLLNEKDTPAILQQEIIVNFGSYGGISQETLENL